MTARRPTRLPVWHEWSIYLSFAALLVTGIAWLVLDRLVRVAGEFGPEHHPAEHVMLILHGIAAYVLLIVAGAVIPVHVKVGWSIRRNRVSGASVATMLGLLSVTALALYYVSADSARGWDSLAHWAAGIAAVPVLLLHVIRGKARIIPPRAGSPRRRDRPRPGG